MISVDFDVMHQTVIIYSAFVRWWRKMGVLLNIASFIYRFREDL